MSILDRLTALEFSASNRPGQNHIARFIVRPGNQPVISYTCGDIEIVRLTDESDAALQQRCLNAVQWPDDKNHRHIFKPLEVEL